MVHDAEEIQINNYQLRLQLTEVEGQYRSIISVEIFDAGVLINSSSLHLDGTTLLYSLEDNKEGGTMAGMDNNLLISCGDSLFCYSIPNLNLNWTFQPDQFDLFEFYRIEDDILIRGESAIYRIDKAGNKIWSFTGEDIFINNNGENEVQINESYILLKDADSKEYKIDFQGKLLK